jgi:NAD(P)-dependent dehydrogenase (short-subunit alcohol dehydrogenase family)
MKNFKDRLVLVTGGNSGIGEAIALAFAREGARLVLTARDGARLDAVRKRCEALGAKVETFVADVTDEAQVRALADHVHARHEALDVLVNNAGVVMGGLLTDVEPADWRRLHEINVMGVVHGCRAFLPRMIAHGQKDGHRGHVVNMASASGFVGTPGMSTYCASKFALVGLSESLRAELRRSRIGVSVICPSYVRTPIAGKVKLVGALDNARARERIGRQFTRRAVTPEAVAARTLRAIRRNESLVAVGGQARMGWLMKRWAPGLLARMTGA